MRTRLTQLTYHLSSGELISLEDGTDWELQVQHGQVWLTAHGHRQDMWLHAGRRFALGSSQNVIIEAAQECRLVLRHPGRWATATRAPASRVTPTVSALPERRRDGLLAHVHRTLTAKFAM